MAEEEEGTCPWCYQDFPLSKLDNHVKWCDRNPHKGE